MARLLLQAPRMATLYQDLIFGARVLRRSPVTTTVILITLCLGIGANIVVFSVINAVLLRPLPYESPEELVMVWEQDTPGAQETPVAPANFLDWRDRNDVFSGMAALDFTDCNLTGRGEPARVRGGRVSAGMFDLLRVAPALGRWPTADEDREGGHKVVVLSHALWMRTYGGDPGVVGGAINVNGEATTVVGVMPAGFDFPSQLVGENIEIWVPMAFTQAESANRSLRRLGVVARLRHDATVEQARSRIDALQHTLRAPGNRAWQGGGATVVALHDQLTGGVRRPLIVLMAAAGFVVLIACANVASLLLGRAADREREMTVRTALGATAGRLLRQLFTESLLVSFLGGGTAVLLSIWGTDALARFVPAEIPRSVPIGVDAGVLAFGLALSLMTGILFGLTPAIRLLRARLLPTSGDRAVARGHGPARSALLVVEVALAMMLLAGAGLLIRSLRGLTQVAPGFDQRNLMTAYVALPSARYNGNSRRAAFADDLLTRLRGIPGVEAAAVSRYLPLAGGNAYLDVTLSGQRQNHAVPPAAFWRVVSPGYFTAMGIDLLRGRDFGSGDVEGVPGVVIVSRTMADRFWPREDPIGKVLKIAAPEEEAPWLTVIGVVGDVLHRGLSTTVTPEMYVPWAQAPAPFMAVVVRSTTGPSALYPAMRHALSEVDPLLPLADARPMEEVVDRSLASPRFRGRLLGTFAVLALVLAATGVFGVVSQVVSERTREIGIRIALGATWSDIQRLVVGKGLLLSLTGVALGLAGALALAGLLRSMLFGVTPIDPIAYASSALVLSLASFAACWLPARRATRVDPSITLRYE